MSNGEDFFFILLAIIIGMVILIVSLSERANKLENELTDLKEEMYTMHDYFYAQWANAVGYRAILKDVYNFTINETEPFELYYNRRRR